LVVGDDEDREKLDTLLAAMPAYEQKTIIHGALHFLASRHLTKRPSYGRPDWWQEDAALVAAAVAYLDVLVSGKEPHKDLLSAWLSDLTGAGTGDAVGIRRAAVAVLAKGKSDIEALLERSLEQFGDPLYIQHAPILQQEVHAQVLLLAVGYVHRLSPMKVKILTRSSPFLNAVSSRLAATTERARLLGMVVGEAISGLVEETGKQMDFKMEQTKTPEAEWYKSLVTVADTIGSVGLLRTPTALMERESRSQNIQGSRHSDRKAKPATRQQPASKIISIEELSDGSYESEDDLVPYAKPDSDAEDSDDDPTLVVRDKPTAPVYIRDLINYLRDTESYDKQKLALTTAPSLIRRKSNFGTEVRDHVEELASQLMGLQDKYEIEGFQNMRTQGLIAVLLADPSRMGPWFANTFFNGDYSVSQRASILSTITIAARELGGYASEDKALTTISGSSSSIETSSFPSKRLPAGVERRFLPASSDPIDALAHSMSRAMIQPMAASLADEMTGPNILKVRTFSSRLEVEKRRAKPTTNALSKIVADSFFFPLTGRFFAHMKAYGQRNVVFESYLLSSLIKTLSLIMHAAGQNTVQLQAMTREFWDLLLAVRPHTIGDRTVGEAVCFGFMTILEANAENGERRLAEQHSQQLLETQRWVEGYFGSLRGGAEDEDRAQALAAGVLVRIQEIVERYQALLMGDLANFR
jgi:telomere length regulation protein